MLYNKTTTFSDIMFLHYIDGNILFKVRGYFIKKTGFVLCQSSSVYLILKLRNLESKMFAVRTQCFFCQIENFATLFLFTQFDNLTHVANEPW